MKVVKAAAQVLNTLWQYRELRTLYKQVRTCSTSFLASLRPCFQSLISGIVTPSCAISTWFRSLLASVEVVVDNNPPSLCRTAGTTLTSSHPSPRWSETGTSRSPRCPPAPCGRPPSSSPVSLPARGCQTLRPKAIEALKTCAFLRGKRHVFTGHAGLQETQLKLPEGAVIYATGHLLRGQQFTQVAAHRFARLLCGVPQGSWSEAFNF